MPSLLSGFRLYAELVGRGCCIALGAEIGRRGCRSRWQAKIPIHPECGETRGIEEDAAFACQQHPPRRQHDHEQSPRRTAYFLIGPTGSWIAPPLTLRRIPASATYHARAAVRMPSQPPYLFHGTGLTRNP